MDCSPMTSNEYIANLITNAMEWLEAYGVPQKDAVNFLRYITDHQRPKINEIEGNKKSDAPLPHK